MPDDFAVRIREDYQLLDPATGRLDAPATVLAAGCGTAGQASGTRAETRPLETGPCGHTAELRDAVRSVRGRARDLAGELGATLAAGGLHPFSIDWPLESESGAHRVAEHPPGSNVPLFGLHIAVAVPNRESAVRAMCGAAPYTAPLLALAASSPFHAGRDTGFASYRTVLRDLSPRSGPPLAVASAGEYDRMLVLLSEDGIAPAVREAERGAGAAGAVDVCWDVRPHGESALVFEFMDAVPRLELVLLLAACARALTAMFADRAPPQLSGLEMQVIRENRWRAARHGLAARLIRSETAPARSWTATDALRALVDRLAPVAERLGDGPALAALEDVLAHGTVADTLRAAHRDEGSFDAVVGNLLIHDTPVRQR